MSASASSNLRSCLFMLAAMASFAVNDACTKLALADASTPQIMALRGLLATVLLFALAWSRGALRDLGRLRNRALCFRTVADIGGTISYIVALGHMPVANASAIFQAQPLAVTLGAAVFLSEPVGWRRWTAIGIGFLGILVIVRPGTAGFSIFSVLVLVSVVLCAARDLATRRMPPAISSFAISVVTSAAVTLTGFALTPIAGWHPVASEDLVIYAVAAVAIAAGYLCIVEAMRGGDMGFVAPFRYSVLIFAIVLGFVVFGDVPDVPTLVGSAIVVGSGAYSFYRERTKGRRPKLAPANVH